MEFTSYQLTGSNTASLNTGSYLNRTEYSSLVNNYVKDVWYSFSPNDVVELGVWDRDGNLINWNILNDSKDYKEIALTYLNALQVPSIYTYNELQSDFIIYQNEKVLVNPAEQLYTKFNIQEGSYFLTYNFVRDMAGTKKTPLIVKEISPSKKEVKLTPLGNADLSYVAFCNKKVLVKDVISSYVLAFKGCPCSEIYNRIFPEYTDQINTLKALFFLENDGQVIDFLNDLYEDLIIYSATETNISIDGTSNIQEQLTRLQGIKTYFNNFLLSNINSIVSFSDIDSYFALIVKGIAERKFAPFGTLINQNYIDAKSFVNDFFVKNFYTSIADSLSSTYNEKYFASLRNALNLGNNRVLPIVNIGLMDERIIDTDPLTLLIKLQSELPSDIMVQSHCWVSNVSLTPYIVSAIVKNPLASSFYKIGPPNFSIPIPNASLTNTNLSFTADDLKQDEETDRELVLSKNISELAVDYTDFQNFVVFSSAELRLKIFKNKVITLSSLDTALIGLNQKSASFFNANNTSYPFYSEEHADIQGQITDIINSFDGYESYLYRTHTYEYVNGSFVSSSYIAEMDSAASSYDKINRDSLINNCPEHILISSDNDEYIIFLSMIGHFFDNIFIYIANVPSAKTIGHGTSEEFTRRVVDYMLETFGWKLDDLPEPSNIINTYLTSDQIIGLSTMSTEERLKSIRNRILVNLPQIYKTKGTEESIKLILSCYGISPTLLNIREYGGVNYTDDRAAYTTYERTYLRQWDLSSVYDNYRISYVTGSKTFLSKICIEDGSNYDYDREHILYGKVSPNASYSSLEGSGEWSVGFVKIQKQKTAKLFFKIGQKNQETFKMYSPEFPLFDGNVYSLMLRKNLIPWNFETTTNLYKIPVKYDLCVRRNENGNKIFNLTSSQICYNTGSNISFDNGGFLNIIGGFSYHNGRGFDGAFDKLQIWYDPLSDNSFEDYTNNINSYCGNFSGSRLPHESLIFRMHTDYPFDQQSGKWQNANQYYAVSSSTKIKELYGDLGTNVDNMICTNAWSGSQTLVYDSSSCQYVNVPAYPFQFKVIDYPSTWAISKYGPNKFRNEKIRHIDQSVEARFDDKGRSTYVSNSDVAPDSNQVGLFVDPQDFKNRDIVRYFGNYDFMNVIGDPTNQYSSSYDSLKLLRRQYSDFRSQFSGSKTLFGELSILYKLYFNKAVFDTIKQVIPTRTNILTGMVIEPTILERPKYQSKPIVSELNTGDAFYTDIPLLHYFRDSSSKIVMISTSVDSGDNIADVSAADIYFPTIDYPVNYGGNYAASSPDPYSMGHFDDSILTYGDINTNIFLAPEANFYADNLSPEPGSSVRFINLSRFRSNYNSPWKTDDLSYFWEFGSGSLTSIDINPTFTYSTQGKYTVTLTTTHITPITLDESLNTIIRTEYIECKRMTPTIDFTSSVTTVYSGDPVTFKNLSQNATSYLWDFGSGSLTSTDTNPTISYDNGGLYTVKLQGLRIDAPAEKIKTNYINVIQSLYCGDDITGTKGYPVRSVIQLPNTGAFYMYFTATSVKPVRMLLYCDSTQLLDTGWYCAYDSKNHVIFEQNKSLLNQYLTSKGSGSEQPSGKSIDVAIRREVRKNSSTRDIELFVYAPLDESTWKFNTSCTAYKK